MILLQSPLPSNLGTRLLRSLDKSQPNGPGAGAFAGDEEPFGKELLGSWPFVFAILDFPDWS
jgi:hypothetical protein